MSETQQKILDLLSNQLKENPSLRVCQLISNVLRRYSLDLHGDPYYVGDHVLLEALESASHGNRK